MSSTLRDNITLTEFSLVTRFVPQDRVDLSTDLNGVFVLVLLKICLHGVLQNSSPTNSKTFFLVIYGPKIQVS